MPYSAFAAYATKSLTLVAASNQYATIADNASLSVTGNLTLEAWVNPTDTPTASAAYTIESKYLSTGNQRSYWLTYRDLAGTPNLSLIVSSTGGTGAGITNFNHIVTLSTGTWTHVAVVYKTDGSAEFIINDTSVETVTGGVTSIFDGTANFRVGQTDNGDAAFNGKISLARVWATTRTAAQITASYCTALGATTSLQAEYTFDSVYTDNSGNGNTLTAVNTPTFTTDIPPVCTASFIHVPSIPLWWPF